MDEATTAKPALQSGHDAEYFTKYPNRWARLRSIIREPAAEFLGTMILTMFGTAGNAQGVLFDNPQVSATPAGGWLSVAFGWGLGTGLGAWVAAGISGGHINPAITIALATFRGFSWRKVPVFILAQLLGGVAGAAITYANYVHAIDLAEGGPGLRTVPGTASLFGTYALPYMTNVSAFWDEFLGTFLLVMVLLAVTDRRNGPPPAGLVPLVLFLVVFGVAMAFGAQTRFAINPARDLGPRILSAMAGYGRAVFTFRHQYWLWCGVLAPVLGALVAAFVYDTCVYTGNESVVNRPSARARALHAHAPDQQHKQMLAGTDMV
ncbi:major intrinsic protein superfamily membrane channel protein [Phellopilus nigrolimitatus]|nr:major intrinsic protein superfamily membrane channel protein [Phellopilus nigrolimitatus]